MTTSETLRLADAPSDGELWSLFRTIMSQGADIRVDYEMGVHKGYEAYSARLDAAAAERQQEFWAARIQPLQSEIERLTAERDAARAEGAIAARLCDAAQADAKRWQAMRQTLTGVDWSYGDPPYSAAIFRLYTGVVFGGPEGADEIADAAIAAIAAEGKSDA